MNSNPKSGISITGVFMGHRSEVNGTYKNDFIGIQTAEVQGDYGQTQHVVIDVEVYDDALTHILANSASLVGKPVRVWVFQQCKFGVKNSRPWGFIKTAIVKGSVPELLEKDRSVQTPNPLTSPLSKAV